MNSQKSVEKKQTKKKSVEVVEDVQMKDEIEEKEIKDDTTETDLSLLAFNKMIEAKFKPTSNSDE